MPVVNVDVGGVLGGIGQLAKDLRAAITGKEPINAEKAAELALKVQELEQKSVEAENSLSIAQADINKIEAASPTLFVSGWRPGLGWLIVSALAMKYVIYPVASWIGVIFNYTLPDFPIDDGALYPLIVGMLGLSTARTVEKIKGAAGNH